ncbi:MAG TPA: arsenite methyltransferase [Acidobacteriota bacterium]|nr:arsenite methyltransferase [Acidobacteriota bacterium]
METEEKIRSMVRERYTAAVNKSSGCCGSKTQENENLIPVDRVACSAGYTKQQLQSIPEDAVANSFGCGNPLAFSGVLPGQTVIDIGSGAGIDCLLAAQIVGPSGKIIGLDMTPAMIEKARVNARKAGSENVEFRLGEAEHMPVGDNQADWIISNCVINLSPDKPAVFREAFRVLKSGGQLSVSDIMVESLPESLRENASLYTSCVAGAISEQEYLNGLRDAGFVDVKVTDRIFYDHDQVMGLINENELRDQLETLTGDSLDTLVDKYVVNKVWSARVVARKI